MQPLLLLMLLGLAFLDSLDVLLVGVATAVVYDSRLNRRSPLSGGLSFLSGVFAATTAFGIFAVLGINYLNELIDVELTPMPRYWGGFALGVVLILLASIRMTRPPTIPNWAATLRRRPWLLGFLGIAIGVVQAPTAIPYLAALAMLSSHPSLPGWWPLVVVIYCVIALAPPLLVLLLSLLRTAKVRRVYRQIVRLFARYGPASVRLSFFVAGFASIIDSLIHHRELW
uniref:GAP family protein n=1 Tax=Rhodococcus qingshengii TaxID=334542 RepID=UPI001C4DDAF1|nr:GAP family protein [Rhodococcus qingshengii]